MVFTEPVYTGPKKIRPSELKFCHGTISCIFRDGRSLDVLFEDLLYGRVKIQDLQPLETMYDPFRGNLCVLKGNRTLFVLQKLELYGVVSEISVVVQKFDAELFKRQNLSLCKGNYVKVRGEVDLNEQMKQIWEKRSNQTGQFIRQEPPITISEVKSTLVIYLLLPVAISAALFVYYFLIA